MKRSKVIISLILALVMNISSLVTPISMVNAAETFSYKVSGYVSTDFYFSDTAAPMIKSGFKVEIQGTGMSSMTDSNGYFEIPNVPENKIGYSLKISKQCYLYRVIRNVIVTNNIEISSQDAPIIIWAGDIPDQSGVQNNAINMSDMQLIIDSFNTVVGSANYVEYKDLNKDGAINMTDLNILNLHFNTSTDSYPSFDVPKPLMTITNLSAKTSGNSIIIGWDAALEATVYDVEVDGQIIATVSNNSFIHDNIMSDSRIHQYRVRAKNDSLVGEWTKTLTTKYILYGDLNFDGQITTEDKDIFTPYLLGKVIFKNEQMVAADVNGDKVVNMIDYQIIQSYILGTVSSFATGSMKLVVFGDANEDELVSNEDYVLAKNCSNKIANLTVSQVIATDINQDLSITSNDCDLINDYLNGTIQAFNILPTEIITPTGVSIQKGVMSVTVGWNRVPGATGYDVSIDGVVTQGITAINYTFKNLDPLKSYTIMVRARNLDGVSKWSVPVQGMVAQEENLEYIYDKKGRLIKVIINSEKSISYTYDKAGNLLSAVYN